MLISQISIEPLKERWTLLLATLKSILVNNPQSQLRIKFKHHLKFLKQRTERELIRLNTTV